MALTELIFQITPVQIGVVTLDASVRETHRASARVTEHPVEKEADSTSVISDHVHVNPLGLSIEGVISNTPAELAGLIQAIAEDAGFDPAGDAHKQMLEYLQGSRVVTFVTSLKTYKDMVLTEINVDRNARKGNALFFTATAGQIAKVTTRTVEVKAPQKRSKTTGKRPTKPPKPKPAQKATSLGLKLVKKGAGLLSP
jgi:hypothetical protein